MFIIFDDFSFLDFPHNIKLFNQDVEKYKKEKNDLLNEFKKTKDVKLQSFLKDMTNYEVEVDNPTIH